MVDRVTYPLLDSSRLDSYIEEAKSTFEVDEESAVQRLDDWNRYVVGSQALSELSLEQAFNQYVFSDILGYAQPPGVKGHFQLLPKQSTYGKSLYPDFLLGQFKVREGGTLHKDVRLAVGELKRPGVDLDKVDPVRAKSPVEQAFDNAIRHGLNLKWVIVSNMEHIRLYHHTSIHHYQSWNIHDFVEEDALTENFWSFYGLLRAEALIGYPEPSQLENLLRSSLSGRLELTNRFYSHYKEVVNAVYEELSAVRSDLTDDPSDRLALLQAAQQLIHRGLVICFFSDHPAQLLPDGLLDRVMSEADNPYRLDGSQIYESIKDLFRCIDEGSPDEYAEQIFGYDGGLFEHHPILDQVGLPDELFRREFTVNGTDLKGIYGFRKFDFHADLNEHLLGRIFEESVGDLEELHQSAPESTTPLPGGSLRSEAGLFFTREGLTEYLGQRLLRDKFTNLRNAAKKQTIGSNGDTNPEDAPEYLECYLGMLLDLRIADIACGSGAFLVSCYRELAREAARVREQLEASLEGQISLQSGAYLTSDVLRDVLHGNDLMPEATEISKLSLWIASARKNQPLEGLDENFLSVNTLEDFLNFQSVSRGPDGFPKFDIIIGNPPWGGNVSSDARSFCAQQFPDLDVEELDSFELFVLIGSNYLKPRGSLGFVLPHTLLLPQKEQTRRYILENFSIERYHNLGADWFGPEVRMNTTVLEFKNEPPTDNHTFLSMTLVEEDRRDAILGKKSLHQLEQSYAFPIPQQRCIAGGEIELFRYEQDDALMKKMEAVSVPLGALCSSTRGVELNKEGHVIQCPSCAKWDAPPRYNKKDGWADKTCSHCNHTYTFSEKLAEERIVVSEGGGDAPYIDGDSFSGRYQELEKKSIRLGFDGINYKRPDDYSGDKLFVRQAGVGLSVAYADDMTYCPQSVYVYRIRDSLEDVTGRISEHGEATTWLDAGEIPDATLDIIDHRFLLGLLNSRIFHYYLFKKFGEIDAAQAFAKLTQTKIRRLPVPIGKLDTPEGSETVDRIGGQVGQLLSGTGNQRDLNIDWDIDRALWDLFHLTKEDRVHFKEQLGLVAYHQTMQELFPIDRPPKPESVEEISLDTEDGD